MPRPLPALLLIFVLGAFVAPARAAHWTALDAGSTADLLGIEDDGWGPPTGPWIVGAGGYAAFPNSTRTVWTPYALGTAADIHSVQQPGVTELWFGGDGGVVRFKYSSAGLYTRDVPSSQSMIMVTPGTTAPVAIGSGGGIYDGTASVGTVWLHEHDAGVGLHGALGYNSGVLMVGDQGTVLFGDWTWTTWATRATNVTANLYGIFGNSPTFVAVGAAGTILRSTDAGLTWTHVSAPTVATLRVGSFSKVAMSNMVVVGDGGTVLKSTDAGLTWCLLDAGTTVDLTGVTALDDNKYMIVGKGGTLLSTTDGGGPCGAVSGVTPDAMASAGLSAPFPNPAPSGMTLRYALRTGARVDLAVFDPAGRRVRALDAGERGPGSYAATWDGRDASGHSVAAGLYFIRLHAGQVLESRRIVVAR